MKKLLPLLILSALVLPFVALGQGLPPPPFATITIDIWNTVEFVTNWLFAIALIAAVAFLIVAAINFITASGDSKKHETAKSMIIYALIGVAVAVVSKGLVAMIRAIVESAGGGAPTPGP
ncbi:MAG: hypothetical protein NTW73_00355 [Candidatus Parcubacteria bacterium]|nr:hypothetical protein [Candidatus Parcubacteria bacterium]